MTVVKIQPCGCFDSLNYVRSANMSGQNLLLLKFAALDLTLIILAGCRVLLVVLDFHKLCMFNKKYYVTLKVGDASWRGSFNDKINITRTCIFPTQSQL